MKILKDEKLKKSHLKKHIDSINKHINKQLKSHRQFHVLIKLLIFQHIKFGKIQFVNKCINKRQCTKITQFINNVMFY